MFCAVCFFWVVFTFCIVCVFNLPSVLYFPACTVSFNELVLSWNMVSISFLKSKIIKYWIVTSI